MKRFLDKIKVKGTGKSGFTFVEMLVALLILVMVATIVATGVPAGLKAYRNAVDGSNAQVALSTTASKLRDELSYATGVETDASDKVLYYQTTEGYWASIEDSEDDYRGLVKHIYIGDGSDGMEEVDGSPYPILQDAAITDHLNVGFSDAETSGIYYDNGVFYVYGLEVTWGTEDHPVITASDGTEDCYKIRALSIKD